MTDSTGNVLADIFDGLIPAKSEPKEKFKHKDGALVAYGNYSIDGAKFSELLLRDGRGDHVQMHQSYVKAANSANPDAAKAALDEYWGSKLKFSYNLATPKAKKTIDVSDMPTF